MFHRVVTLLTLSATLLHAVLGCCAHHAHAGDGTCCASGTQPAEALPEKPQPCCHRHDHEHAAESGAVETAAAADEPRHHGAPAPEPDPCEEESCTSLVASKVTVPADDQAGWLDVIPVSVFAADLSRAVRRLAGPADLSRSGLPASLRVQALTQVWRL